MPVDKEALLAAIAQAGTRGADAYAQAQQQLAAQQADAVRAALSGVAETASPEARAQLAQTVSSPYQQQTAHIASNAAGSADYFNRLGAASGTFMDQAAALGPALLQQYQQEHAGGGGGGGGGGGSDKSPFDQLLSDYHGVTNLKDALTGLSKQQGIEQGDLAVQMGVPAELAYSWFPKYDTAGQAALEEALAKKMGVPEFRQQAMAIARARGGNQITQRKALVKRYKKLRRGR